MAAVELLIIEFGRVEVVIKMLKKEEGESSSRVEQWWWLKAEVGSG